MSVESKSLFLKKGEKIPNNEKLPVVIYQQVNSKDIEKLFHKHNWLNSWTNGVYSYHHFHSNTHEVLCVVAGEAVILLGGETGESIDVSSGDVLVLPAGTGHKKVSSSSDFKVVGAYPSGMEPDLKKEDVQCEKYRVDINSVPLPNQDPIFGSHGPLIEYWNIK
ncbi:cupin domain-containing protein [Metabacillus litoralis]|uniref:cupin domain-containing protein n=1 Tax=Metabacillus litoralis TaxID=152268 RepID=UPI001CFE0D0E|nr:cupin domain-containing protein [Metabacillus litoralis]